MFTHLPTKIEAFTSWNWAQIAPFYAELQERPLTPTSINQWLADWSKLSELVNPHQYQPMAGRLVQTQRTAV